MYKNCLVLKNIIMYIVFSKMKDCIFYLRGKEILNCLICMLKIN